MKLRLKLLVYIYVSAVAACIGLGLFFTYRSQVISARNVAVVSVSNKQKAYAFEVGQTVYHFANLSKSDSIPKKEITALKALLFKWDMGQKALVNGDENYGTVRSESQEMVRLIQGTASSFIAINDKVRAILLSGKKWSVEDADQIATHVNVYATAMNDVTVLANNQSDLELQTNFFLILLLIPISLVVIVLGYLSLLRPLLKRSIEADSIRETAAEELNIIRQEKKEFLTSMSQEIRTPLIGIIGMSDLMLKTPLSAEQLNYSKAIKASTNRLLDLVDDIVDHNTMESGDIEIVKNNFHFFETIDQVIDLLKPSAVEKNLELIVDIDPALPVQIVQDERRLRQVIINLVGNAIKFTTKGEVVLKAELLNSEGGFVQIKFSVIDTGVGIDTTLQRRIFQSFTQVGDETGTRPHGSGLGLAISKKLIDKMGGRIWVESEIGKGTKFTFTIVAEAEGAISLSKLSALNGKKAFIVDENKTNLKVLVKQLASQGIQAIPFNSVDLAFDTIGSLNRYDIGIISAELPKVQGLSLVEHIRDKKGDKRFPLIGMSSTSQGIYENKSQLFDAFLTKPIKQAALLETIYQLLEASLTIQTNAPEKGHQEVSLASKHLNILIAHDNDLTRAVTEKNLSLMGHKCISVNTPDQILEYAGKRTFDLMLVDAEFSNNEGIATIQKLRRITSDEKMPLIIGLSERAEKEKKRLINAGMDDVISRDPDSESIQKALETWFE